MVGSSFDSRQGVDDTADVAITLPHSPNLFSGTVYSWKCMAVKPVYLCSGKLCINVVCVVQVKSFVSSADDLMKWFEDFRRKLHWCAPLGALPDSARSQLKKLMVAKLSSVLYCEAASSIRCGVNCVCVLSFSILCILWYV